MPELVRGLWLYTVVTAEAEGPPVVRAIWEANLVAGALRDELHAAAVSGELVASDVDVALPNGQLLKYAGGGVGNIAYGQAFSSEDRATLVGRLRESAESLGLSVESIEVLRAAQHALSDREEGAPAVL